MILLDREVDVVTPMCTQLTYEGLIDETLQIKNGSVTTDASSGALCSSHKLVLSAARTCMSISPAHGPCVKVFTHISKLHGCG